MLSSPRISPSQLEVGSFNVQKEAAQLIRYPEARLRPLQVLEPEQPNKLLYNLDQIIVEEEGLVHIELNKGYHLQVSGPSRLIFELWDGTDSDDSPLYLHVLQGHPEVTRKGPRGSVLILSKGQLFYPEAQQPLQTTRQLLISQNPLSLSTPPLAPSPSISQEEPQIEPPPPTQPSSHTLSNTYIDETIAGQRKAFQKCQTNALRETGTAEGTLLIGLTISPRGDLEDIRLLHSTVDSEILHRCVLGVFERIKFRSFNGPPIVRMYPLRFE